jgi:hypothetical protein
MTLRPTLPAHVETDPVAMNQMTVGLPDVIVLGTSASDEELALKWVTQLDHDLQDHDYPIEARSLGRTLIRWRKEIAAWHVAHVTNGPTEAVNNLIKRVKRAAFGFTSFRNYRIRSLLYAGKSNWDLLVGVTPR